jgi:hypothetical protein
MEPTKYDLFVSFSKADTEFAERLVKRVESEPYNNRLFRCFYAPWDIQPGENILLRIEEAEPKSRFIGIIMSPDWARSNWTTLERSIPVYDDPAGLKARIIPILRRNCEIPPSIRILNWLDFTHEINFERELRRLLARLGGSSGRPNSEIKMSGAPHLDSTRAVIQDEILASNLFGVTEMPRFVYSASSKVKDRNEVFSMLGEGVLVPPFVIREDEQKVYSFSPLESTQTRLGEILNEKSTQKVLTTELVDNHGFVVIELLNRSMTAHMRNLGMTYDWNSKKTFYPLENFNDGVRTATWRVGNRQFKRKLVAKSKSGQYFAHRSCKATFQHFLDSTYLKVSPGWHFTVDGTKTPVVPLKMSSLSARWMNIERNHTLLDNLRFWANVLSKDSEKIVLDLGGDVPAEISSLPVVCGIDHGIEQDYRERLWYEAEPEPDEADLGLEQPDQGDDMEVVELPDD